MKRSKLIIENFHIGFDKTREIIFGDPPSMRYDNEAKAICKYLTTLKPRKKKEKILKELNFRYYNSKD